MYYNCNKKGHYANTYIKPKKLTLVLANSVSKTNNSGKKIVLKKVPCIHYLVWFPEKQVKTLFDSGGKINAMNPAFAWKLGLHIRKTNIKDQKIDDSTLKTFGMVIADFQVEDKDGRSRFFQEFS